MRITCYSLKGLTPQAEEFWRSTRSSQDDPSFAAGSPEWYSLMTKDDLSSDCVAVVRDEGGEIKCVVPLLFRSWPMRVGLAGRSVPIGELSVLKVCGGDFIDAGLSGSEVYGICARLCEKYPGVDGVWLEHVVQGERSARLWDCCRECRPRFFCHVIFSNIPHYRLKLAPTLEECLSLRSAKSWKRLQEKERSLSKDYGPTRTIEMRTPAEWEPYKEQIQSIMTTCWQAGALDHRFDIESQTYVADRGWARCFLLMAGDRPAAFVFCYQLLGTLTYEHMGYDQELAKYSPGSILLRKVIECLYESNTPRYVDYGEGEAEYKKQLANDTVWAGSYLLVRSTFCNRFSLALLDATTRIDGLLRLGLKSFASGKRLIHRARLR